MRRSRKLSARAAATCATRTCGIARLSRPATLMCWMARSPSKTQASRYVDRSAFSNDARMEVSSMIWDILGEYWYEPGYCARDAFREYFGDSHPIIRGLLFNASIEYIRQ